jgi:GrpB-like predicted nucleotidyltransferase (UPF0157 family)
LTIKTKQIEVIPYNQNWPEMFEVENSLIRNALGDNCLACHHVGSTAVPGLAAKPIIDIIAVVKDPDRCISLLEKSGYAYRGEWNIPFKYGFTKREDVEVNLHVFEEGHPEIELNLLFRDYLRGKPDACGEYAKLKYSLLEDETSHQKNDSMFAGYTLQKEAFIRGVLNEIGFNRLRLLRCTHYNEWEAYHRIRQEQIFDPVNVSYDRNHPTLTAKNHFHFILIKGTQVVSVAHIEFLADSVAAYRSIATDAPFQRQGLATFMVNLLEKWIKSQGQSIIKAHAALKAESFYRKLGYDDIPFEDPCINDAYVNLGKRL